jgi:hypothetical protein
VVRSPDARCESQLRIGAQLVGVAGCVLFAATFLPWTSFPAEYVDGGEGTQSFSGWDLLTDCARRSSPGQCVLRDPRPAAELVPDRVVAGDWALVLGAALVAIGVALRVMDIRVRRVGAVLATGWVAAVAALACGVATVVGFVDRPNGALGPSIEVGAAIAAASPALALVGIAVVQAGRARDRAITTDERTA